MCCWSEQTQLGGSYVEAQPIRGFSQRSLVSKSIFHFLLLAPDCMAVLAGTKMWTLRVLMCSSGTPVKVVMSWGANRNTAHRSVTHSRQLTKLCHTGEYQELTSSIQINPMLQTYVTADVLKIFKMTVDQKIFVKCINFITHNLTGFNWAVKAPHFYFCVYENNLTCFWLQISAWFSAFD